jgi:hypothetical protein
MVTTYMVSVESPSRRIRTTLPVDAESEGEARDIVEDRWCDDAVVLSVRVAQ